MKICFVLLHAYPVVEPNAPGVFGGSETRAVTLANGLAKQTEPGGSANYTEPGGSANYTEHEICFIVRNPALKQPRTINGVQYIPWRDFWTEIRAHVAEHLDISVLPKIRIKRWSWKLLWEVPLLILSNPWRRKYRDPRQPVRIFEQVNADLYCSFGINAHAVRTVYNAKLMNRSSLIFLGSDMDLDERYRPGSTYISPYHDHAEPSYWVLKNAERIITQTEKQQLQLKDRFDRESDILANPFDLEHWQEQIKHSKFDNPWGTEKYVLWVGRAEEVHKKPSRFVELARQCPARKFLMILNASDPDIEKKIKQQAPQNLKIIDAVPFNQMPGLFSHARIFVNTSAQEGFPNVFLQAIASKVLIVSYEVGQEFMETSQAGICVQNDVNLVSQILHEDSPGSRSNPDSALDYLREHYLCSSVCHRLNQLLVDQVRSC